MTTDQPQLLDSWHLKMQRDQPLTVKVSCKMISVGTYSHWHLTPAANGSTPTSVSGESPLTHKRNIYCHRTVTFVANYGHRS